MKNKFISNAGWIIGGKIFQMAISFVVSMLTARYLGPSNFGTISYAASFVAFFTSIASLGLNDTIVVELINNKGRQGEIIGTGIVMRIASSVMSAVMIFSLVLVLNPGEPVTLAVAVLQSISLLFQSFELISYWYQSKLNSRISTLGTSVAYIVVTLYKVILLVLGKSVIWFSFATSLDYILIAAFLLIAYKRSGGSKMQFSFKMFKGMLGRSRHFILSGLMVALYGQMDRAMIGSMIDKASVGYYAAAVSICSVWVFLLSAVIDSARPIIVEYKKSNRELYIRRIKQLYAAVIWISIAMSLLITLFSNQLISLIYGKQYLAAVGCLRILTWYTAFSYLGAAKSIWLMCEEKQKYVRNLSITGAVVNLVLNFAFIPLFGIYGAAAASLITQIVTNFVASFFIKDMREDAGYICDAFMLKNIISIKTIRKYIEKIKSEKVGK